MQVKKIKNSIVIIIVLVTTLTQVIAQDQVLKFKEAVDIALKNNINLKQQLNQLNVNNIQKTSSLTQLGPSINARGNLGRNDGNSFNQQEGRVINGTVDFMSGSINANMPLFNGMNRINTYRQSKSELESQIHLIKRTNQDVIQQVSNQYLQCLLDIQLLAIGQANLDTQKKILQQINEQVEAGSRAKIDAFNQEVQLKNAELQLLRAQITLRNDKLTLSQTLQLSDEPSFEVTEPNWDVNTISLSDNTIENLYEQSLNSRADLLQAKSNEKAANFSFKSTKGNYLPSLNLFFSYGSQYNNIKGFENRTFDQQFLEDNLQTTYGLSFNIPIFGGLSTRLSAMQSKVQYENAKLNTANTESTVKADVLRAHQNYQDALINFEASKAQLDAAELSYSLENERYTLGASDLVAFTQASQSFVSAKADMASARYNLLFQDILLQYATGTLKIEDIP
jgi:outer membrane protein